MERSKLEKELVVDGKTYHYLSIDEAVHHLELEGVEKLPKSLKVLFENILRNEEGESLVKGANAINEWVTKGNGTSREEIFYYPARVVMQDFTGVPAVVDLAAQREAVVKLGGDPKKVNPLNPVDLVIDHSLSVEHFGSDEAYKKNMEIEYKRNNERYQFLKWGQKSFKNFRVVPPGMGIIHQVNLEHLAQVVWTKNESGKTYAYPDTCVGTDSHTTMINGLSVLGWGVGGIEAEAAMLGGPITMIVPEVVGVHLSGKLQEGITATDLVLRVVEALRKHGVVGKFVEFYGPGVKELTLADRATLANMAPEYGATCGFFPIDEKTIDYMRLTGRSEETIKLVEAYAKTQGFWGIDESGDSIYTSVLSIDLNAITPSIAGPKRPQDRVELRMAKKEFLHHLSKTYTVKDNDFSNEHQVEGKDFSLKHGDVVIAAITSCTNTSNPSVLMAAGLVAKKAREKGLTQKPWVKTSLAPGSQVVTEYLKKSGLQQHLNELGFQVVGHGCTTCIGNSGPLPKEISKTINDHKLVAVSVLSGNRNFEGRVNPDVKANYLASPPLVVAYAIAGNMKMDIFSEAIGKDKNGKDVFLKDIWPTNKEIEEAMASSITRETYEEKYKNVFQGDEHWQKIEAATGDLYQWDPKSTYIRNPTFFEGIEDGPLSDFSVDQARVLAVLGDSVTTDHISPAGNIAKQGPAARYLIENGVSEIDFNSYGARRGNHEVMMRGTFANIRIRNEMVPGTEGGLTLHTPSNETMSIYDAAAKYQAEETPLVVFSGLEYGTGSSRDWAAKGTFLLGVKAVVSESFERIHRSNLVGMGVLPLEFPKGTTRRSLKITGDEIISLKCEGKFMAKAKFIMTINRTDGSQDQVTLQGRIDTQLELQYFKNGGILQYVVRDLAKK